MCLKKYCMILQSIYVKKHFKGEDVELCKHILLLNFLTLSISLCLWTVFFFFSGIIVVGLNNHRYKLLKKPIDFKQDIKYKNIYPI